MRRGTYNGWPSLEWHHKDGERMYWAVFTWRTAKALEPELADSYDQWSYEIYRSQYGFETSEQDDGAEMYRGTIAVQPGLEPEPQEILADFMAHVQRAAFGLAQYRDEWYGKREGQE